MYIEILLTIWFLLWLYFKFAPSSVINQEELEKFKPKSFKESVEESKKWRENNKKEI